MAESKTWALGTYSIWDTLKNKPLGQLKQPFADLEALARSCPAAFASKEDCEQQVWDSVCLAYSCDTYDEYKLKMAISGTHMLVAVPEEDFHLLSLHKRPT